MIANSQQALGKANELMSFYSQFLSYDFFGDSSQEEEDDEEPEEESFEDHMASKSLSAISGFFNKIKNTFEDSNSA